MKHWARRAGRGSPEASRARPPSTHLPLSARVEPAEVLHVDGGAAAVGGLLAAQGLQRGEKQGPPTSTTPQRPAPSFLFFMGMGAGVEWPLRSVQARFDRGAHLGWPSTETVFATEEAEGQRGWQLKGPGNGWVVVGGPSLPPLEALQRCPVSYTHLTLPTKA